MLTVLHGSQEFGLAGKVLDASLSRVRANADDTFGFRITQDAVADGRLIGFLTSNAIIVGTGIYNFILGFDALKVGLLPRGVRSWANNLLAWVN